jgi:hypothetical protein
MATVKPDDPEAPRRLVRAKSNLGPDTGGFEYRLFSVPVPGHAFHAQRVEWGAVLEGSARELMAVETPDEDATAIESAEAFLRELLTGGPVARREIAAAAQAHGHASRTLFRAKAALGVVAEKDGMQGGWTWRLPPPKSATLGDEECHDE